MVQRGGGRVRHRMVETEVMPEVEIDMYPAKRFELGMDSTRTKAMMVMFDRLERAHTLKIEAALLRKQAKAMLALADEIESGTTRVRHREE